MIFFPHQAIFIPPPPPGGIFQYIGPCEGNHIKNLETLKEQKGFLIMAHGVVKYSPELKYGHCLNCFGYYSRKSYARHRCITNKKSAKDLKRKAAPIKEGDAALQVKVNLLSPEAANIMASMNDDAVGRK
jgi:hypothetical protein